ncbi:hypothetical protein CJI97_004047 [Candidozyma auris]|nr:hypothetical protein CJI97_004047 [[Candida] auris]
MPRLEVPPVDPQVRGALDPVLKDGIFNDDDTWSSTLLPSLLERLQAIKAAVLHAQKTNASGPQAKDIEKISTFCEKIEKHLKSHFQDGAPFTIYRIAELLLEPEKSGYSLTTVQQAERFLAAFARTIMVVSKETEHLSDSDENGSSQVNGANGKEANARLANGHEIATPEQYEQFDLPKDVTYISLPWVTVKKDSEKETETDLDDVERPSKKQRANAEEDAELVADSKPLEKTSHCDSSSPGNS